VRRAALLLAVVCSARASTAFADEHAGMVMDATPDADTANTVTASAALLAAQFSTMYYVGSYQGVVPAVAWSRGALAAAASLPVYHLDENGAEVYGIGDAMLHAHADLAAVPWGRAGAAMMVMVPTGNGENGLGMGHAMLQPSLWTVAPAGRVTLTASAGFNRAIAQLADHVHGIWPLVEPMNMSEITWSGAAELAINGRVHAGARLFGGVPIGAPGIDRVIAAARVSWTGAGRVTMGGELQAGLAGDPFTVRAVLDTAVRF
jgi:hypothetical protein